MSEELDVAALSRRFGPMVLRRCRQLLRDEDDALDACQDVFVRLVERRRRLDDQYPSSLLYRMATNVSLNRIRERTRRPETRDEETLFAIACAVLFHHRRHAVCRHADRRRGAPGRREPGSAAARAGAAARLEQSSFSLQKEGRP